MKNPLLDPAYYHGDSPVRQPPEPQRAASRAAEQEAFAAMAEDGFVHVPSTDPVDYATGGGWYVVDGQKVQGKAAAQAIIDARA